MSDIHNPGSDMSGSGPVEYRPAQAQGGTGGSVAALLARHEARLLGTPGVTSVGVGVGPSVVIGVLDAAVGARLPRAIEGVPVVVDVTGPVEALGR